MRGSDSIGRRLQDPLAELVKIDAKPIGVGVEVNTASRQLLTYVSGLKPTLASNIVAFRNENGPFKSRADLRKVKQLGPKALEKCAGFLRVRDGKNPLDTSAVHPECYAIVQRMAADLVEGLNL